MKDKYCKFDIDRIRDIQNLVYPKCELISLCTHMAIHHGLGQEYIVLSNQVRKMEIGEVRFNLAKLIRIHGGL